MEKNEPKYKPRELELMAIAMQCILTGVPTSAQLDNVKFAAAAGMSEGSVKVTWGKIRKRLEAEGTESGAGPSTLSPAATKTPKRKNANPNGDETPVKKARANKGNKNAAADGNAGEESEGKSVCATASTDGQPDEAFFGAPGYVEATKLLKDHK